MDRHRIGIVIPALNEARTIGTVVRAAISYGVPIVVDDGSRDDTSAVATAADATVVRHNETRGYDEALNSGFRRAAEIGCDYVLTLDADGQHDPTTIGLFVQALDRGADVVVGIRDHRPRIAEIAFGWLSLIKWRVRDPLCGMKAYRMALWRELGHFDSYCSIGTELVLFAARGRRPIAQIPIRTRKRVDSPRFGQRWGANRRVFRALWLAFVKDSQPT